MLALFGALYGSLKALAQPRVTPLLAHTGVAFYSVLWWHAAGTGTVSTQALVYAVSVILVIGGLLLTTSRLRARYGGEAVDRIGGLARPMPRFAVLMTLLTMAAIGLPPFGFFSGSVGILLRPSVAISWELIIIVFTRFAASFYLFRLMQRILFGPHSADIPYEDLNRGESVALSIVLLMLVAIGLVPYGLVRLRSVGQGLSHHHGDNDVVAPITQAPYSETQRMELRALIRLSSEIIAYYWPMRTFVHHNPLHGLEVHPFDEAVGRAQQLLGGKGYLANEIFRDYVRSGRILPRHLDLVLKPFAQDQSVKLGERTVTQLEVLRACFLHKIDAAGGRDARPPDPASSGPGLPSQRLQTAWLRV